MDQGRVLPEIVGFGDLFHSLETRREFFDIYIGHGQSHKPHIGQDGKSSAHIIGNGKGSVIHGIRQLLQGPLFPVGGDKDEPAGLIRPVSFKQLPDYPEGDRGLRGDRRGPPRL